MKVSGIKVMYYGGSVIENEDTKEINSYLSFVQINKEKNKMEQILTTYKGDIRDLSITEKTIFGAGLVAGECYILDLDMNLSNEKDKDGKAKATRHTLLGFKPAPVEKDKKE